MTDKNLEQAIAEAKTSRTYRATYALGREVTRYSLLALGVLGLWKLLELLGAL